MLNKVLAIQSRESSKFIFLIYWTLMSIALAFGLGLLLGTTYLVFRMFSA